MSIRRKRIKVLSGAFVFLILFCLSSCDKNIKDNPGFSEVRTIKVYDVKDTSAYCLVKVSKSEDIKLNSKGICWSVNPEPTTDDNFLIDSTELLEFSLKINGLIEDNIYYFRSFVSTNLGTVYGDELSITTNGTYKDSRDGNIYRTVKINKQVWMAENLGYLPEVSDDPNKGSYENPYYYVYDYRGSNINEAKATEYYNSYGVLYNWPAAIDACPDGWHLPSDDEWKQLEVELGIDQRDLEWSGRGTNEGSKLAGVKSLWNDASNLTENEAFATSGFSALPGGYINYTFQGRGETARFWTSTKDGDIGAVFRTINSSNPRVFRQSTIMNQPQSVRCLKD